MTKSLFLIIAGVWCIHANAEIIDSECANIAGTYSEEGKHFYNDKLVGATHLSLLIPLSEVGGNEGLKKLRTNPSSGNPSVFHGKEVVISNERSEVFLFTVVGFDGKIIGAYTFNSTSGWRCDSGVLHTKIDLSGAGEGTYGTRTESWTLSRKADLLVLEVRAVGRAQSLLPPWASMTPEKTEMFRSEFQAVQIASKQ